jgi:pectate lyase
LNKFTFVAPPGVGIGAPVMSQVQKSRLGWSSVPKTHSVGGTTGGVGVPGTVGGQSAALPMEITKSPSYPS